MFAKAIKEGGLVSSVVNSRVVECCDGDGSKAGKSEEESLVSISVDGWSVGSQSLMG